MTKFYGPLLNKIEQEINEAVDQETGKVVSSKLWKGREITAHINLISGDQSNTNINYVTNSRYETGL